MKTKKINKHLVFKSIAKMFTDKESVISYLNGEMPIQTLTKKGIKLGKPF